MKSSNCILILLGVFYLHLSSCSTEETSEIYTIFSGVIENNATSEIRIENKDTVIHSPVDETGNFKIRFKLDRESVFNYVGNEFTNIYLSPGDSLFMQVDSKTWREFDKTLTFSGKGGAKNNYFFKKSLKADEIFASRKKDLLHMNEKDFMHALDSTTKILTDRYNKFVKENPQNTYKLLDFENESIDYLKKSYIIQFFLFNKNKDIELKNISLVVKQIIDNLDLNNKEHIQLETYNQLVINYFNYMAFNNKISDTDEKMDYILTNIDKSIKNNELKASISHYFIGKRITKGILDDSFLERIKNQISVDSYTLFKEIFNKLMPLAVNDKAPDFKLFDRYGNEYTLNNFKGNYIYIDVWASYCGPCIKEAPKFEQLKKDFKGKNISFVSVSLDRKESNWVSAINKYEMTQHQLRPKNDWSSNFVKDFSLNHYGIPHYIIIDPNGIIVRMPAPKPSKANGLLKQLL